jgi:hypothetical protein
MLEGLDAIPWSTMHHALGQADDIPTLLRMALSDTKETRDEAFEMLHQTVWHQGTVYEASIHVVPFLWEMIRSPEMPDKASVVYLLASLADGNSYLRAHAFFSKQSERQFRALLAEKGLELEAEMAKEEGWVAETREAVEQGLHLLYPLMQGGDSDMRWCVAQALGHFPEHAQETLPLLQESLASEVDEHTVREIKRAIGKLTAGD